MRLLSSVLWYAILAYGTVRAFAFVREARTHANPADRARGAAKALGVAGIVLWIFCIRDEARSTIGYAASQPDVMELLSVLGASIIWGILVLGPMWTPRWLLSGAPGALRCGLAAFVAYAIAAFAGCCILVAPFMFGFSNSLGEFLNAVLGVAIPLLVLILIATTTASLARRVGAA